jgi:cation diffusion facilitator family transporter
LTDETAGVRTTPPWHHAHGFLGKTHDANEKRTRIVIALTAATMTLEIAAGLVYGSMALLADGWHMASHAAALGIAALGYALARRHAGNVRFSFGTGKMGQLAGYTSALVLGMIALIMGYESVRRLFAPVAISFDEAIAVTCLGLLVNIASAFVLKGDESHAHAGHAHAHDHAGGGDHDHGHGDHNLKAAYAHVLADALTSVLALVALATGRFLGWVWMDPVMGIVGACVITRWSYGLARRAARTLLDMLPHPDLPERIRARIEAEPDTRITDLHVWNPGPGHTAVLLSVAARAPKTPEEYKRRLQTLGEFSHVTVEVNAD